MAITKIKTVIWSGQTLAASTSSTTGSWVDLTTGYGAQLNFSLRNYSTGPTVAAQVQIQTSNNFSATNPDLTVDLGGPFIGSTTNSGVSSWSVDLPWGLQAVRLVAGSNTAQPVTGNADISIITAI